MVGFLRNDFWGDVVTLYSPTKSTTKYNHLNLLYMLVFFFKVFCGCFFLNKQLKVWRLQHGPPPVWAPVWEVFAQCTSPFRSGDGSWPVAPSFRTLGGTFCGGKRPGCGWLVCKSTEGFLHGNLQLETANHASCYLFLDEATKWIWPRTKFSKDVHQISCFARKMCSFPLARVFECWIFSESMQVNYLWQTCFYATSIKNSSMQPETSWE